jgi:hypothetical protein
MEFSKVQVLKSVYLSKREGWVYEEEDIFYLTKEEYIKFVSKETLRWFRNLGSRQVPVHAETSFGSQCVKLTSYAPYGVEKHVYNFRFLK